MDMRGKEILMNVRLKLQSRQVKDGDKNQLHVFIDTSCSSPYLPNWRQGWGAVLHSIRWCVLSISVRTAQTHHGGHLHGCF